MPNEYKYDMPSPGDRYEDVIEELIGRVNDLEIQMLFEEHLRKEHPALQEAYEQYQTVKKLIQ